MALSLAVTKIWDVKSHLGALIAYVSNTEKTVGNYSEETLKELVDYGVDDIKTEERKYVTAINCSADSAATEFNRLNEMHFGKFDTIAYHAYQSATRS